MSSTTDERMAFAPVIDDCLLPWNVQYSQPLLRSMALIVEPAAR